LVSLVDRPLPDESMLAKPEEPVLPADYTDNDLAIFVAAMARGWRTWERKFEDVVCYYMKKPPPCRPDHKPRAP
jgi:hypothetical protein